MGAKRETELPGGLKKLRGELEEWRGQRRRGQRIPEELWGAAVRAVGRHGLNRVSRALGLDYYHLKKRCGSSKEEGSHADGSEQVFVEVASAAAEVADANAACVVELEKGNGVRMRICVRDAATVDWSRMKEAFLGA
jgi:hypothetical protein